MTAGVAVVYLALSVLANRSAWSQGIAHTIQTAGGNDVPEEVWFLAQTPWILLHAHNPLVNNWLNAPGGIDLMDNTTMPLLGILGFPITLLFGPIATFNVLLDLAIFASAMSFFAMARRFVRWWPAAFIGGLAYGFSPFTAATANGHLFLLFQAVPPLLILFVDRFFRSDKASPVWSGVAVGLCFVAQFYISTEVFASLLVMTAIGVVIGVGWVVWKHVPLDRRRTVTFAGCAAVIVALGIGYGAWLAVAGPQHITGPAQPASAIAGVTVDPLGLIVPTIDQHFTFGHAQLGDSLTALRTPQWKIVFDSPIENGSYVGVPLLIALVVGAIVLRRKRLALFCAAMGGIALILSFGSHLHYDGHRTGIPLPFFLIAHLPLLDSSVASRWITYFWLFAALLLTLLLDATYKAVATRRRLGRPGAAVVSGLVALAVLLPLVPAWPYSAASRVRSLLVHHGRAVSPGGIGRPRLPDREPLERLLHAVAGHGANAVPHAGRVRCDSGPERGQHIQRPVVATPGGTGPVRGWRVGGAGLPGCCRPRAVAQLAHPDGGRGPRARPARRARRSSSPPRSDRGGGRAASWCGRTSTRRRDASPADLRQHGGMAHDRTFRFAAQLSKAPDGSALSWAAQARKAEDLGYSALLMPDHFGDQLAPVPALAAVAAATTTLRMGSLVFGNDYRHPFVLAKEAATLDVLSDGRFEMSLGAGWMRTDYDEAGLAYDHPAVRVARFEEAVKVVQGLLRTDGPFNFHGEHYEVLGHTLTPRPVQQPGPPLIIGGGGKRVLSFAARHADIVSINVNLREGTGGAETAADATPERTRTKIGWVKEAAGDRFAELELNSLIGFVMVTDDAQGLADQMAPAFGIDDGRRAARAPGAHRDARRDGRRARVAPGRVRHLVLVDRIGRLGDARPGRGQVGGHMTITTAAGWEAIGTHRAALRRAGLHH